MSCELQQETLDRAARIRRRREELCALKARTRADTAALARELVDAGVPVRDIATMLGTSFQRVSQLAPRSHPGDL